MSTTRRISFAEKALLPGLTFLAVLAAHFLWTRWFPEPPPAQAGWVVVPPEPLGVRAYLATGDFWLGYAYALPLAFAVAALGAYRRCHCRRSGVAALGGVGLGGGLAAMGCFLVGCCGSPMLAVWAGLLGAKALPLAKPTVAAVTTLTVALAGWWMNHRRPAVRTGPLQGRNHDRRSETPNPQFTTHNSQP